MELLDQIKQQYYNNYIKNSNSILLLFHLKCCILALYGIKLNKVNFNISLF